jgi:hypothetical protein
LIWSYNKTNQSLLNNYLPLTGGILTGNLIMNNNIIYLRNNGDTNHYIKYNSTYERPLIVDFNGGAIGSFPGRLGILLLFILMLNNY